MEIVEEEHRSVRAYALNNQSVVTCGELLGTEKADVVERVRTSDGRSDVGNRSRRVYRVGRFRSSMSCSYADWSVNCHRSTRKFHSDHCTGTVCLMHCPIERRSPELKVPSSHVGHSRVRIVNENWCLLARQHARIQLVMFTAMVPMLKHFDFALRELGG